MVLVLLVEVKILDELGDELLEVALLCVCCVKHFLMINKEKMNIMKLVMGIFLWKAYHNHGNYYLTWWFEDLRQDWKVFFELVFFSWAII